MLNSLLHRAGLMVLVVGCHDATSARPLPADHPSAASCPWGTHLYGYPEAYTPEWCELPFGMRHGPMWIPHFDARTKALSTIERRYIAGVRLEGETVIDAHGRRWPR